MTGRYSSRGYEEGGTDVPIAPGHPGCRGWRLASPKPRSWVRDHWQSQTPEGGSKPTRLQRPVVEAADTLDALDLHIVPCRGGSRASCAPPAGSLRAAGDSDAELRSRRSRWGTCPSRYRGVLRKGFLGVRMPSLSRFFANAGRSSPSRPLLASSIASRSY